MLEGQKRTAEEQVPGMKPLQGMICQLPPPGICSVLNSKTLFQKQKTPLSPPCQDSTLAAQSWWNSTGSIPCSERAANLTETLKHETCEKVLGRGRDGVRWKRQNHAGGEMSSENRHYPCPVLSVVSGSMFISQHCLGQESPCRAEGELRTIPCISFSSKDYKRH